MINEDWVAPGAGFPTHSHRDMEIVTYVIDGAVQHKDSMGNGSVIRPGDVQRMSAGTGVTHSEYNPSKVDQLHLLQIWMLPDRRGHQSGYEQKTIGDAEKRGRLRVIASPDGRDGSVSIHQDARLYAGIVEPAKPLEFAIRPDGAATSTSSRAQLTSTASRSQRATALVSSRSAHSRSSAARSPKCCSSTSPDDSRPEECCSEECPTLRGRDAP